MSLSAFCDLVWLELWDDCGPMGDQVKYRDAIQAIFYEGRDPDAADVIDPQGNRRTVSRNKRSAPSVHDPIPSSAMDALKEMQAQIAAAQPESE